MGIRWPLPESRVARRIVWLFVLSMLIPLALSDWLAIATVSQLARDLQARSQAHSTRQTGLQVLDRLLAAKALLVGLSDSLPDGDDFGNFRPPALASRVFYGLARLNDAGGEVWTAGSAQRLASAWQQGDSGADEALPTQRAEEASRVVLRLAYESGALPRLLLGASSGGHLRWVAELRPAYVWEPLADATIDSVWQVTDARHRLLATHGEGDVMSAEAWPGQASSAAVSSHSTALFLAADFGAGDWLFSERREVPEALWHGVPLTGWLALVAAATVLASTLLGVRQIRGTLVPLRRLTEGTRGLVSGASGTRVEIKGVDEFAELGQAFNEMATRIEDQISSLELLASIDRDVLAGTAIDVVAERVLVRLRSTHPEVAMAICWLDDRSTAQLSGVSRDAGAAAPILRVTQTLTAEQAIRFAGLRGDEPLADASHACFKLLCGAKDHESALLPLRWGTRTQAVLMLCSPPDMHAEVLELASELRDRLAVAFSARDREAEMVHRAAHDSLTGLDNRYGLNEFVDRMLLDGLAPKASAVLFIDLDNFKDANDSLGHETGDQVLCEAGRRLQSCAPAGALIARQGGDEFVLVLPGAGELQAREVADEAVRRLGLPFDVGGEMHRFGASVGVALYPEHGESRVELLRHADAAMYAAKAAGRGRSHVFDASLEAATHARLHVPAELRRALERGELVAHYQPRVSASGGHVTSAEALVRWKHPERGLLMPEDFISLAEESQLIDDIGLFMLDDACSRMAAWQRMDTGLQRVSVNVSPRQLASGDLPGQVQAVLRRHGLPAQALELEVTESLLIADAGRAHRQLAELRQWGVSIALDDFGTGYSSMAMLRNLPLDVMKIDRAFVKDLGVDEGTLAITHAIVTLARTLGLGLVAEGVETELQASLLGELGCDEFQGYLYSRPLTPEAFAAFVESRRWQRRSERAQRKVVRHAAPQ